MFPLNIVVFEDDEPVKFVREMLHTLAKVKNVNEMDEEYLGEIVPSHVKLFQDMINQLNVVIHQDSFD
jgi:hypothetical protein